MKKPHRIRLRGPWVLEGEISQTFKPPCLLADIAALAGCNQFICMRKHGRPSPLAPEEEVYLVIEGDSHPVKVVFNNTPLEMQVKESALRGRITPHLLEHNQLTLEFDYSKTVPALFPEVCMEITQGNNLPGERE